MASPPASTKTSLGQKLRDRAQQRWPQLTGVTVRFRGPFAYITGQLPGDADLPLCRLRYVGYASTWGFAIYRASHDDYQDSYLPSGQPSGTPEEALDCACGLYLGDPSAWLTAPAANTPTELQPRALVRTGGSACLQRVVPGRRVGRPRRWVAARGVPGAGRLTRAGGMVDVPRVAQDTGVNEAEQVAARELADTVTSTVTV